MNGGHRYDFEWDPPKAKQNLRRHGVSFERAATVFLDPSALSIFDTEHSAHEDRWITLGMDKQGVMLVVSHTFREVDEHTSSIRIITTRKATRAEQKQYEQRQQ
jgi:uncharacterized DUF497 family protein